MKILLTIHHHMDKNLGAPGVTWNLGQEYKANGHDVSYFSFDDMPSAIRGILVSILFPLFVAFHIVKLIWASRIDVVVASTGDIWLWGRVFRVFFGRSPFLVTQSHGLEHSMHFQHLESARLGTHKLSWKYPIYHGGFKLWEVSQSLQSADMCFFLNSHDARYAVDKLKVNPKAALVAPNGLPDYLLGIPFQEKLFRQTARIRIVQIGRFTPDKGSQYSRVALEKILKKYRNVEVSFIGTCCDIDIVLSEFDENIRSQIRVVPRYANEELPMLLESHQIKLFPTLSEGFGIALLEAMACGLAPIATYTPGPCEIITPEYDGILIPSRDSQAIEDALERLILDKKLLSKLQANAYRTAQKYSWSRIVKKRLSIYEDSCSDKNLVKV
jgi:glycosyltransferase involved in cell wall biosynthesis